jgi:archaellum biogenesis ATPase FlaH
MVQDLQQGRHLGKTFCNACGSSDALSAYEKPNGWIDGHCFSALCGENFSRLEPDQLASVGRAGYEYPEIQRQTPKKKDKQEDYYEANMISDNIEDVLGLPFKGWRDRKIKKQVYETYGVRASNDVGTGEIDAYYYPTYRTRRDTIVGFKIRKKYPEDHPLVEKGKVEAGSFKCFDGVIGDNKKGIMLFGQNLHATAPRRVFIHGGQEDAMAGFQIVCERKQESLDAPLKDYGFVSPQNGENDVDIRLNLEWFDTAEEIYLCFDNDEAGDACTEKVSKLFPPKKLKLMSFSEKDASDMLKEDKQEEFWSSIWRARPYSPAGIVGVADAVEALRNRGGWEVIPWPPEFEELNKRMLGGRALGEITTLIAPSSIGKSIITNSAIVHEIENTPYNVAMFSLEADRAELLEQLSSIHNKTRLIKVTDEEQYWNAIDKTSNLFENRLFIIEELAEIKSAEMFWNKVNYLVNGLNCKTIVFDPATLGVRAMRVDEEEFLADLVGFVKKTKVDWINVVHVRKNDNSSKANSEGKEISEEDAKGSGAWTQNSMNNILASRNKLASNEIIKNTTKLKLSKCRRHGEGTGIAGFLYFNSKTNVLEVGVDPSTIDEAADANWDSPEDYLDKPLNSFE